MKIVVRLAVVLLCGCTSAAPVKFSDHHIHLTLDVPTHSAAIADSGSLTVNEGVNWFYLNRTARISDLNLDGKKCKYQAELAADTARFPSDTRKNLASSGGFPNALIVAFKSDKGRRASFEISFVSVLDEDVANVRFSREAVGSEVSGTILEQGAYLSPSSYFYPQGAESPAMFSLAADIPGDWESVSDGNRVSSQTRGDRKLQSWHNLFANDGCSFMAAPYVSMTTMADSTEVVCLFFEADTALAPNYLEATANYIKMYSNLIGPYPFKRFTVAENFFPTGYGMPGWTLLGQSVLKLPFIISSSLGHEVLHNWWGNSVYVDYSRGNWCEGLTVYGADYRYKLTESPAAAREYRRDILKQYISYVSEDKDFPLRNFTSRTSPNTRAIGYNKAMMLFHMIEEEIGSAPFSDALKQVYRACEGKQVGWEEWVQAFEQTSGKDLSYVIPQWIDRTGAPVLGIEILGTGPSPMAGTRKVKVRLTESSGVPYRLHVPIEMEGGGRVFDTAVVMEGSESIVDLIAPAEVSCVSVDPEYHLFRRLYPEEVEPIMSAVLGAPEKKFVAGLAEGALRSAFVEFCTNVDEDSVVLTPETALEAEPRSTAMVLLNPISFPDNLIDQIQVSSDSITIAGRSFLKDGHTFIFAGRNWNDFEKCWVVLTADSSSLPRLGQLVPHYGKYSYLVFEGAKNVAKGQWEVTSSPLRVTLTQ